MGKRKQARSEQMEQAYQTVLELLDQGRQVEDILSEAALDYGLTAAELRELKARLKDERGVLAPDFLTASLEHFPEALEPGDKVKVWMEGDGRVWEIVSVDDQTGEIQIKGPGGQTKNVGAHALEPAKEAAAETLPTSWGVPSTQPGTFSIYYVNHDYTPYESFASVEEAVEYGKGKGFEFSVLDDNGDVVAAWGPLRGLTQYGVQFHFQEPEVAVGDEVFWGNRWWLVEEVDENGELWVIGDDGEDPGHSLRPGDLDSIKKAAATAARQGYECPSCGSDRIVGSGADVRCEDCGATGDEDEFKTGRKFVSDEMFRRWDRQAAWGDELGDAMVHYSPYLDDAYQAYSQARVAGASHDEAAGRVEVEFSLGASELLALEKRYEQAREGALKVATDWRQIGYRFARDMLVSMKSESGDVDAADIDDEGWARDLAAGHMVGEAETDEIHEGILQALHDWKWRGPSGVGAALAGKAGSKKTDAEASRKIAQRPHQSEVQEVLNAAGWDTGATVEQHGGDPWVIFERVLSPGELAEIREWAARFGLDFRPAMVEDPQYTQIQFVREGGQHEAAMDFPSPGIDQQLADRMADELMGYTDPDSNYGEQAWQEGEGYPGAEGRPGNINWAMWASPDGTDWGEGIVIEETEDGFVIEDIDHQRHTVPKDWIEDRTKSGGKSQDFPSPGIDQQLADRMADELMGYTDPDSNYGDIQAQVFAKFPEYSEQQLWDTWNWVTGHTGLGREGSKKAKKVTAQEEAVMVALHSGWIPGTDIGFGNGEMIYLYPGNMSGYVRVTMSKGSRHGQQIPLETVRQMVDGSHWEIGRRGFLDLPLGGGGGDLDIEGARKQARRQEMSFEQFRDPKIEALLQAELHNNGGQIVGYDDVNETVSRIATQGGFSEQQVWDTMAAMEIAGELDIPEGEAILVATIVHDDGKWRVESEEGKNLGEYDSEEGAKKRLQQVEYFKHKGQLTTTTIAQRTWDPGDSVEFEDVGDRQQGTVVEDRGDDLLVEASDGGRLVITKAQIIGGRKIIGRYYQPGEQVMWMEEESDPETGPMPSDLTEMSGTVIEDRGDTLMVDLGYSEESGQGGVVEIPKRWVEGAKKAGPTPSGPPARWTDTQLKSYLRRYKGEEWLRWLEVSGLDNRDQLIMEVEQVSPTFGTQPTGEELVEAASLRKTADWYPGADFQARWGDNPEVPDLEEAAQQVAQRVQAGESLDDVLFDEYTKAERAAGSSDLLGWNDEDLDQRVQQLMGTAAKKTASRRESAKRAGIDQGELQNLMDQYRLEDFQREEVARVIDENPNMGMDKLMEVLEYMSNSPVAWRQTQHLFDENAREPIDLRFTTHKEEPAMAKRVHPLSGIDDFIPDSELLSRTAGKSVTMGAGGATRARDPRDAYYKGMDDFVPDSELRKMEKQAAGPFKEEEHPRDQGGQFAPKGTPKGTPKDEGVPGGGKKKDRSQQSIKPEGEDTPERWRERGMDAVQELAGDWGGTDTTARESTADFLDALREADPQTDEEWAQWLPDPADAEGVSAAYGLIAPDPESSEWDDFASAVNDLNDEMRGTLERNRGGSEEAAPQSPMTPQQQQAPKKDYYQDESKFPDRIKRDRDYGMRMMSTNHVNLMDPAEVGKYLTDNSDKFFGMFGPKDPAQRQPYLDALRDAIVQNAKTSPEVQRALNPDWEPPKKEKAPKQPQEAQPSQQQQRPGQDPKFTGLLQEIAPRYGLTPDELQRVFDDSNNMSDYWPKGKAKKALEELENRWLSDDTEVQKAGEDKPSSYESVIDRLWTMPADARRSPEGQKAWQQDTPEAFAGVLESHGTDKQFVQDVKSLTPDEWSRFKETMTGEPQRRDLERGKGGE